MAPSRGRRRIAAFAVLVTCVAIAPAAGAATPDLPLKRGDFAGTFGIGGGRSMYLECYGSGSPTVVLDAGLRNGASFWNQRSDATPPGPTVMLAAARLTRVCGYDRPGTLISEDPLEFSRSSAAPMPRSAAQQVSDLHALLDVATVPGPYVFVSHSHGGLIDRLYTATYPRAVAGLVLVDSLSEFFGAQLDAAQLASYSDLNNGAIPGIDYPAFEAIRFARSFEQMRRARSRRPLRGIPVGVVSKGLPFGVPEGLPGGLTPEVIERAWRRAQNQLGKLTADTVHVIARRSSHYVMLTQPNLIIDQLRRVVRTVRRPGR